MNIKQKRMMEVIVMLIILTYTFGQLGKILSPYMNNPKHKMEMNIDKERGLK